MITYNHERYIEQAVESVINQKTTFKFRLILAEDFSTDKTRVLCQSLKAKYPEQIQLILNEKNLGVVQNARQIHKACAESGAVYIAILEGDDYWLDEFKLQKQVDFLEANPDYTICGTDAIEFYEETQKFSDTSMLKSRPDSDYGFLDLAIENKILTPSVLFRNLKIYSQLPQWFSKSPFGDWSLYLILSQYGRAKNLNLMGVVYRRHSQGIYSAISHYHRNRQTKEAYKIFIKEFKITDKRVIDKYRDYIFWTFIEEKDKKNKRNLMLDYIKTKKLKFLFDRTFLKMTVNYFFE